MLPYEIANIILSVVLISTFIGVFFFTYASMIEKNIVETRCKTIVEDLTNSFSTVATPNVLKSINEKLEQFAPPNLSEEDKKVAENNKALIKKSAIVISLLLIVGLSIVFILYKIYKFPVKELIINNLIMLVFVALTEFTFLTFFAQNFITVDSNFIKNKIISVLIANGTM